MPDLPATLRRRPELALLALFALSRVAYRAAGVRFDARPLVNSWQYLDPELLEHDLLVSVWYSHTQPPLFNLALGAVLQLSPFSTVATFEAIYLALGVAFTLLLHDLLRRLGASPVAAFVTTALVIVSPATVLYQNFLFYTFPLAVLLLAAADLLHRYVQTPRAGLLTGYASAIAAIVLIRSMFHPLWYAAAALVPLLAVRAPMSRRVTLTIVGLPLVLMLAWSLRAAVLFDTPTMSSWSGMNASRATTQQLPASERRELVAEGTLSDFALVLPFLRYEEYANLADPCTPDRPNVPVLSEPVKSTGFPNFNYECYLPVYDAYGSDVSPALRADPGAVLRGEITALQLHLQPNSIYNLVKDNRAQVDDFDEQFRRIALLEVTVPAVAPPEDLEAIAAMRGTGVEYRMSLTVVFGYLATFLFAAQAAWAWRRGARSATNATLVFIGGTVLWVLVVGNLFEFQENHRFRFMIDPFLFAMLGLTIDRYVRRFRAPRDTGARSSADPGSDGDGQGAELPPGTGADAST
jgi:hypothetical protein